MQSIELNNGVLMPMLGFGVFQVRDPKVCEESVLCALETGYRSIDTAAIYGNEVAVGNAIKKSGIPREELFITTKLWVSDAGYESAKAAYRLSCQKLGVDYVDLYLVHQPFGNYYGSYKAMEELLQAGDVRAIGVSNFDPARVADIAANFEVIPAVNQIEYHPFFQQKAALAIHDELGIVTEAWGPFAEATQGIFTNPVLESIAQKHGKTVAQVILRWDIQTNVVTIPKSVHPERIRENFDIWDFELDAEDMALIAGLDKGHSELVDHRDARFATMVNNSKVQ